LSVVFVVAALIAVPRDVTRALEKLSKTAASGNPEDPEFRLDTSLAPPEVSGLVRSLNLLLDRLQELSQRQRRFLSDVAHELRTPLAIMRLRLDDLHDSDNRVQLMLDVDRLDGRIEALVALARLREGLQVPQIVDLVHIAREIVIDRAPRAMAARCDLSIDVQGAAMVLADRALIETAATNLVDNAIAHAGAGASIIVRVQTEGILEVIDDGRGIPSDRRTEVLQPFTRDSEAGLLGLGLALVNEAVLAMGGTFTLVETEGGGTTARLHIPSQAATEFASG
jgi:signal transduction histidine kinase